MCQKFIGYLKTFFERVTHQIQHVVGCSECKNWIKGIISHMKGGENE